MAPEGFDEYQKRSFCRDTECPVQLELNKEEEGSDAYMKIKEKCRECGAWKFHRWLTEKGFLILRSKDNQVKE